MKPLRKLLHFFVYSNLFIAACAVLMAAETAAGRLQQSNTTDLLQFIFFSTICSYNFHYYFTSPVSSRPERKIWVNRNQVLIIGLFLAGLAGSVWNLVRLWEHRVWLLPAAIATFLYSAPMLPHPLFRHLRKIAYGKTIFLAFIWMYVTTALPILVEGIPLTTPILIFAAGRYFFFYCICILFDFRDRDDDRANGVKSLITFLNEKNIVRLFILSWIAYAILTLLLTTQGYGYLETALLLGPGILLALLFNPARRNQSDLMYFVILDGLMALPSVLMLFARI